MKNTLSVLGVLLVSISLTSCRSTFDMGTVQYYMVSPRVPSHVVDAKEAKKYQFEPYAVLWSMLGTVNETGPKLTPVKVVLGGHDYTISNVRTLNKNHELYYMFEIRDQNPIEGLPVDLMTGNLTATEPSERERLPVRIVFRRVSDNTTWEGVGKIEQETMLTMDEIERIIETP